MPQQEYGWVSCEVSSIGTSMTSRTSSSLSWMSSLAPGKRSPSRPGCGTGLVVPVRSAVLMIEKAGAESS